MVLPNPPSPSSDSSTTSSGSHASTIEGSENIEFYLEPDVHQDPFSLRQPDDESFLGYLIPIDDTSITTDLSDKTVDSLFSQTPADLIEPEPPIAKPPTIRDTVNPSWLNEAGSIFFCQSLIADDPAQPTLPGNNSQPGTPPD
jgi:hypothetical protein